MKQILRNILYIIFPLISVWGIVSCSDIDNHIGTEEISLAGTPINVSATAEEMEVSVESRAMISRAEEDNKKEINAEELSWLRGALEAGLAITYSDMTETTVAGKTKEVRNKGNERVAILKYNQSTQKYSFFYKKATESEDDEEAKWNDNGLHYFEGQYVPEKLRKTTGSSTDNVPANLISDQSNDQDYIYNTNTGEPEPESNIGNYTLLSHYIGMPPSWKTSATVDFIRLPFKHRLSRVLAYVLIDESLNTTLRGYNTERGNDGNISRKDDPNTTYFYFNHVKVLDHVEEGTKVVGHDNNKISISTLTPKWTEARRVIPHFYDEIKKSIKQNGEVVSADNDANNYFIAYEDTKTGKKTYPRDANWSSINTSYRKSVQEVTGNNPMSDAQVAKADSVSGYRRHAYKKVPIYDIIVRPTYNNSTDNVMYDEEEYYTGGSTTDGNAGETANDDKIRAYYYETNSIFFELELESGLQYSKTFTFDLNANQQTVVYLTIDRSGISYDESSYETWIRTNESDGYYGVDNGEDNITHNLSEVGSSWQRAIRNGDGSKNVTDGNFYNDDNVNDGSTGRGQYMNPVEWTKEFAKAWAKFGDDNKTPTKHGDRHGYYFMLDNDIEIDMRLIPNDFIFTGHLDGKGHKITLTNTDATVKYVTAEESSYIEDLKNITYTNNNTNIEDYYLPDHLYELFQINNLEERTDGEWVIPNLNVIESTEEREEGEWVITNLDALQGNENRDDGEWNDPNLNGVEGNEDRGDGGWTDSNVNGVEGNEKRQDGWKTTRASSQSRADGNNGGSTSKTYYLMVKVNSTEWADLKEKTIAEINCTDDITKYYYKKTSTSFSKFKLDPHSVYLEKKVTANNYLFAGMNGMYVTAQETALGEHPTEEALKNYHGVWEANVHAEPNKATNNTTQYNWVPYTGYRGELLNVELDAVNNNGEKISNVYFFPTDTDIKIGKEQTDKVNGYIINCKNNDRGLLQNIVDIPRYN